MAEFVATVTWKRDEQPFVDNRYSRGHVWKFDGGLEVPASSSPHSVRVPLSVAENIDPEEALVASVSSCHMLWFLSIAAEAGYVVDSYVDDAFGVMEKNAEGHQWMSKVTLRPIVTFAAGKSPTRPAFDDMHHQAHEVCFVANSIRGQVVCQASIG